MTEAYATGRGSFRLRARWRKEEAGRGTWRIVVTEIPYQVQKSRLIERIAELLEARKLTLLDSVSDESAEDIRLVLTPKSRAVDAAVLMETLFRATDLETRFPLNMNLLDASGVPRVMDLHQVLTAFIDHRRDVLLRRSRCRLGRILQRLEVLEGYLAVHLNLDALIRIVREEDRPGAALMAAFDLTERQAEAILNMRLRALRRLEETKLAREREALIGEAEEIERLLDDETRQKVALRAEFADIREKFGEATEQGRRRTVTGGEPPPVEIPVDATVEREPVTVVLSVKGWVRAVRGHGDQVGALRYKEGDRERFRAEALDHRQAAAVRDQRALLHTLACGILPGGRGYGDPVRLMLDLGNDVEVVAMLVFRGGRRLLVASSDGRGFVVAEDQVCHAHAPGESRFST